MMTKSAARCVRLCAAATLVMTAGACSTLRPEATPNPSFYALEGASGAQITRHRAA